MLIYILKSMNFWKNVEAEREYQGISRKELAYRANISYAGIGLGLERNSMPGADTALKISKVLDVSLEYLLGEELTETVPSQNQNKSKELNLYYKYKDIIKVMEEMPINIKEPIRQMILKIGSSTSE